MRPLCYHIIISKCAVSLVPISVIETGGLKMSDLKPFDKITFEQYEALSEDIHIEIFEGILYDMANPSQEHQTISMELSTTINNYIKKKHGSCRVFSAPFDVKLNDSPLTIVQPDLMVICDPKT